MYFPLSYQIACKRKMRKRNPVDDEVEWNELKCVPVVVLVTVGGDCMSKRVSL